MAATTRPISCALAARRGKRERLHAGRRQAAVDEAHVVDVRRTFRRADFQIACAAGHRPNRKMTFAASAATAVCTCAEIDAVVSCATSGTQRGFFAALLLLRARQRERIVRRDEPEHVPAVEHAEPHLIGRDAEPVGHAHRERGRNPGPDLDRLRGRR